MELSIPLKMPMFQLCVLTWNENEYQCIGISCRMDTFLNNSSENGGIVERCQLDEGFGQGITKLGCGSSEAT